MGTTLVNTVESTKRFYKNVQMFNLGFTKSNQTTATANVNVTLFTSPNLILSTVHVDDLLEALIVSVQLILVFAIDSSAKLSTVPILK